MKKIIVIAVSVGLLFVVSAPSYAQVAFDGKRTSFHSTLGGLSIPGPGALPLMVGTIAKGKKRSMLTIDATLTSGYFAPGAPWTLSMGVDVNGIPVTPWSTFPDSVVQDCGSDSFMGPYGAPADGCTVAATFLMDIDAAELAAPGCCVNKPLVVTLHAGTGFNPIIAGILGELSMAIRMEKKK